MNYEIAALAALPNTFTGFSATTYDGKRRFDPRGVHSRRAWDFVYHLHGSVHHSLDDPSGGHDFTARFPLAAAAVMALPAHSFLIDGEAIVTDDKGLAVFELIRRQRHGGAAVLCAFDLIELEGEDLRRAPIEHRKRKLAKLVRTRHPGIVLNEHYDGDGDIVYQHACKLGCEGIVSKQLGSPYRSGRSAHWVKVKNPKAPAVTREAEEDWGR